MFKIFKGIECIVLQPGSYCLEHLHAHIDEVKNIEVSAIAKKKEDYNEIMNILKKKVAFQKALGKNGIL